MKYTGTKAMRYSVGNLSISHTLLAVVAYSLVTVLLIGTYLHFAWTRHKERASTEAIVLAQSLEAMLHPEHVATMAGGLTDQDNPGYKSAKESLMRLVETTNPIRFAYLMGIHNGNIIFLADSEPVHSPDYSPPGQVYEEADDDTWASFRTGRTVLTGPATDRWGTWISVLVPVQDPESRATIAVIGIDYDASDWYAGIWSRMVPDLMVVLSLLLLFAALTRIWLLNRTLKSNNEKLNLSESLFHSILDQAPIGIAIGCDCNIVSRTIGDFPSVNRMFEKIVQRSENDMRSLQWADITHPEDLEQDRRSFEQFKSGEINGYTMEKRYLRPDGSIVWVNMMIATLLGGPGPISMHLCLIEDISSRKQAEEELRESERSKSVLLSHLPGLAYRCRYDQDWTMLFVSEGCQALTGYAPENLINNQVLSYNNQIVPEFREQIWSEWKRVLSQRRSFRYEYEIKTKTGERKWVLELGQGIFDRDGNVEALEGVIFDITELKKREAQITYLNERDYLTGLFNRRFFEAEKARLDKQAAWPLSIAICDINGLKMINDAFGHAEGDQLISDMARLIQSNCPGDYLVSRTGGDEFTVLMPRADSEQALKLVTQIQHAVETYNRNEKVYEVSLSVGYSTIRSGDGRKAIDEAVKAADAHLNHRKLLNQKSSHNAILSSIMATLYARSHETEEHGQRLTSLTGMIGKRLGLEQKLLDELELFSMLHDIGKIGVDDRILNKPDRLTPEEWEQMKLHSEIGYRIAMSTPELEHIAGYILHHHERWDGKGYPGKLMGRDIPLASRILAVADSFDAMTEDRVYRRAMPWETALEEIGRCSGTQFDPDVAHLFMDLILAQKSMLDNEEA